MKIQTKLKLNTWVSLSAIICITIVLGWSFWEVTRAEQNILLVDETEKAAFERVILRDDWILYREDRARDQWYAKTESMRKLLAAASLQFTNAETKELLEDAKTDFESTASILSAIMKNHQKDMRATKLKLNFTEAESRLMGQVFLKAYSLKDSISRLKEHSLRNAAAARSKAIALVFFCVLGAIAAIVANSFSINRTVKKRLIELNEGLAIIGNGNLEYQIDTKGNDELADLARRCNEMAAQLKKSYTSIDNLRMEVFERMKAQESMRESEDKFKYMFDSSVVGKSITLPDGKVNVNKAFGDMLGYSMDELTQIRWQDITHPDDVELTQKEIDQLLSGKNESTRFVKRFIHKNGSAVWVDLSSSLRRDKDGKPLYLMSITVDITEQKRMEKEIKRINEELEQRVIARTAELSDKTAELERINNIFVNRELRMRELKERIAELEKKRETDKRGTRET